jgi:hypothetical protein
MEYRHRDDEMEFLQRNDQRNYIYRENDQINDIYGEGRSKKWNIGRGMMKWNFGTEGRPKK